MNKLLLTIGTAMLSFATIAAQCEGVTKAGERCKREAAEGSAYCIGHEDQAKAKTEGASKEKDDGQCWAVTESGKRCKRKKNGESDYCKQHSPDKKPAKSLEQCRAMTWDGKQCVRKPVENARYCKQHMGKTEAAQ